jgi:hypothetical protein
VFRRFVLLFALAGSAAAEPAAPPAPVAQGSVEVVRRIPAAEAKQGVAVDRRYLYAVDNSTIGKYDKKTGAKTAEWKGDPAVFPHLNSCAVIGAELVCASSNYPQVPHASSVEIFDPRTLKHTRSVSLGQGRGSLTWVDRKDGAWWANFANYDGKGGEPPRDHASTVLVRFDDEWRQTESWSYPQSLLDLFKPMSTSGGAWGPHGRLYLTGHDNAEVYVVTLPEAGATLNHVATLAAPIEGQAIDWDESEPGMLYGIVRSTRELVQMRVAGAKR